MRFCRNNEKTKKESGQLSFFIFRVIIRGMIFLCRYNIYLPKKYGEMLLMIVIAHKNAGLSAKVEKRVFADLLHCVFFSSVTGENDRLSTFIAKLFYEFQRGVETFIVGA